jgi:hypothetical protein
LYNVVYIYPIISYNIPIRSPFFCRVQSC